MLVLVVDDDPEVRGLVRRSLEREAFSVVEAGDAEEAQRVSQQGPFDAAVLDVGLPGTSGLELLHLLRRTDPGLPVILLTGAGAEADRVHGLVSGADDYVVKPFSVRELVARVMAVARRRAAPPAPAVEVGGLRLDVAARRATMHGKPVELTRREFELLLHLASHPGQTFSREHLLRTVWASSAEWQGEATVTEHVRRLRSKIEVDPARPRRITTVRGCGYQLEPEVGADPQGTALPWSGARLAMVPSVVIGGDLIVDANDAALALLRAATATQVIGHPFLEFVAPESKDASTARQKGAREGHWPRPEVVSLLRCDGVALEVEVASLPVLWEGAPASQLTLWDVTPDRVRIQEMATGFQTEVADAVIVTDIELRIRSFNPAAEELYGWTESEVVGHRTMDVLPWIRDDEVAAAAEAAFVEHGRWHGEVLQARKDGSTVLVRSSATMLREPSGRTIGIVTVNRPVAAHEGPTTTRSAPPAPGPLDDEIRRAIDARELTVHYQPVVELDTGRWQGVEALARWQHPERGLLAPAAFIEHAERSGAIIDLGLLVLAEACQQWQRWHQQGLDLHVAVNLSGRQLADPDLVPRVAEAMAQVSMPAGQLWLEVTETSLVEDLAHATGVLRRLAEQGALVSIDDFGTGWASLTYLRQFPVHALKIDRVFVAGLGAGGNDEAIVGSIISLGAELGLSVVAEGIETAAQLAHLRNLGCRVGQGYHFARPAPAGELRPVRA